MILLKSIFVASNNNIIISFKSALVISNKHC